jgi:hypothetical protein
MDNLPLNALVEKRIQQWLAEPWLLLQRTFMVLAAVTLVGGIGSAVWSWSGSSQTPVRVREANADLALKAPPSWDYYWSAISKGNLFGSSAPVARPKPVAAKPPPAPVHKVTLAELAADLTLVGIVNNGGQAAIMSNKTKEVSYVSVGQQIGQITVAAIEGNQVKLTYEGETMALSL